ncbi:MAG TPA: hypothetical protein PLW65_33505 [Pseudomonadota bacterium]|nr:hypothetical protein [Pseudomonadota bacterium]
MNSGFLSSCRSFLNFGLKLGLTVGALCAASAAGCGPQEAEPSAELHQALLTIDSAKELFITDRSVVDDPVRTTWVEGAADNAKEGAWTFGRLMKNMAGSQDLSAFTIAWLKNWESAQNVNGFTAAARPNIRALVIAPWLLASGCLPIDDSCKLNFARAPFRLQSINSRIDLRRTAGTTVVDAGEGRFIFNVLDSLGNPQIFNVIFEYQLPASDSAAVLAWAKRWHALGKLSFGSEYNDALQAVTELFAGKNAAPERPNGSALNQLRTNEVALANLASDLSNLPTTQLWELREFNITTDGLVQTTVKQNPDLSFNNSAALATFLLENAAAVKARQHTVPASMLGASALNPANLLWNAPGVPADVRKGFAIETCNGCHKNETGTANFQHVTGRRAGAVATLSSFITTIELPRRAADLLGVLDANGDGVID